MKYVVAEARIGLNDPIRVVMTDYEWAHRVQVSYRKLFETDTVAEAEALVALLPTEDELTGVNT